MPDTQTPGNLVAVAANKQGFTGDTLRTLVAIAYEESTWNTTETHANTDGTTDYGMWQINSSHAEFGDWSSNGWQNLDTNASMMKKVYGEQGLNAWRTYKNGAYKSALGFAQAAMDSQALPDVLGAGTLAAGTGIAGGLEQSVGGFLKLVESGNFWTRVGAVAIGGALLVGALAVVVKPAVTGAAKVASKVPIPV